MVPSTAMATGSGNTYTWSFGDGASASTASTVITHDYNVPHGESQTFSVMLTVKNSAGSAMAVTADRAQRTNKCLCVPARSRADRLYHGVL